MKTDQPVLSHEQSKTPSTSIHSQSQSLRAWHKALLFLGIIAIFLTLLANQQDELSWQFKVSKPAPQEFSQEPIIESQFVTQGVAPSVHSSTAVALKDDKIRAFWFGGSREGAKDVAIYTSVLDPHTNQWSLEVPCVTRKLISKPLFRYIKKLGNPVAAKDNTGRLWLFYVSVSMGGWSGSALNLSFSDDEGKNWSTPKRVITSPFLNISNLVKGPPIFYQDGTMGLPVYHEFLGKFGELLRLDKEGNVIYKTRLTRGRTFISPVIVPCSSDQAFCLLRYTHRSNTKIHVAETTNGGRNWSKPRMTKLPNRNSVFYCQQMNEKDFILAFNNSAQDRDNLSLAYLKEIGKPWEVKYVFESHQDFSPIKNVPKIEYSYPCLAKGDNFFHLLYTWHRKEIKHIRFNHAWIQEQIN